ncbi:MAG TPA: CaiB/BaiF CoA-transferase family protein [Stellaceae bacterium]|nr:CaiB/BaiF CoA-transferase family protein [Stellaceae bacterium]
MPSSSPPHPEERAESASRRTQDADAASWPGPLAGVKVIDLTRVLAGPFATQSLGDLGAEVLKIEPPGGGDETRHFPPFLGGESHYFLGINRNKKSLVVDLQHEAGKEILRRLVAKADILVENYRPGVMERLGLGYEALARLNPRLIYCAISGFGLTGPLRDKPSFDIVTQALSGALSVNGERNRMPVKLGIPLGDMVGGVFGPMAVLAALHERHRTGRGRLIDISLHDGLVGMLGYFAQLAFIAGADPQPMGSSHPNIVPYGSFPASDGSIIIAVLSERFWGRLCEALERPDLAADPRFASPTGRRDHRDELDEAIASVTRTRSVAEWEKRLEAADVPHAPVLGVGAALASPQAVARGMVASAEHASLGPIRVVGRPIKFPGAEQPPLTAPPTLGQHTAAVLRDELGYDAAKIEELRRAGVIDRIGRAAD